MASWGFLTNHARVLLCIAHDPGMRLRDVAARLDITERSAHGIITDLTAAGYLVKQKDGRRNRYQIQAHLPLPEPASRDRTVGEVLALLTGNDRRLDGFQRVTLTPGQTQTVTFTLGPPTWASTTIRTVRRRTWQHRVHVATVHRPAWTTSSPCADRSASVQ